MVHEFVSKTTLMQKENKLGISISDPANLYAAGQSHSQYFGSSGLMPFEREPASTRDFLGTSLFCTSKQSKFPMNRVASVIYTIYCTLPRLDPHCEFTELEYYVAIM